MVYSIEFYMIELILYISVDWYVIVYLLVNTFWVYIYTIWARMLDYYKRYIL